MAASPGVGTAVRTPVSRGRARAGRRGGRAERPAAALVAATLLAVWLLSGVPVGDIARFLAYEALYVVLPGCLLCLLLSPASWELNAGRGASSAASRELSRAPGGRLLVLAVGWPLGYALEIGAFALTAELHVRGAFLFLPLLAVAAFGPGVVRRHRRTGRAAGGGDACEDSPSGGRERGAEALLAAGAIALALVLLAVRFFAVYPLPEHANSVFYFVDNVWDVSQAAEAVRHWPIAQSYLAGSPFRYYIGTFLHIAAVKQAAGVPVATTVFRLLPAMSTIVAMLQFWCLGGLLGRSRWAGPVTVALLVFIENLKLFPTHTKVFGVALFSEFTWSPTYGLGVVFLLGLLILFRLLFPGKQAADRSGAGAPLETPTGPAPTGVKRPAGAGALALFGLLALGMGAVKSTAAATFTAGIGLLWLWWFAKRKADRLLLLCVALSAAAFAAMYLLLLSGAGAPATTEAKLEPLHFMKFTVFASFLASHPGAAPLAAASLVIFPWKLLPAAAAVWPLWRRGMWSPYASLATATFAVGFAVYVLMGSPNDNENYFIWYGYIALIPLAAASLMAVCGEGPKDLRRAIGRLPSRGARALVYGVLALVALGCAESIVLAVPDVWRTIAGGRAVPPDSPSEPGMTAALYRGLVWVRDHTGGCAVLAVNTPEVRAAGATAGKPDSGYFYYSAFTEREVFFESWVMTIQGLNGGQPSPGLFALNDAATLRGDPAAVRRLARAGVSYILSDKSHGGSGRAPAGVSRLVFSNSALNVYRLTAPVGPRGC